MILDTLVKVQNRNRGILVTVKMLLRYVKAKFVLFAENGNFSNQIFHYTYCITRLFAEAHNKFAGPTYASLRPNNTDSFKEMSLRWRAISNTMSDLSGPRLKSQTSLSKKSVFFRIMKSLVKDLISVSVQRNAKLILRR